jgi:hypothetical protein
MLHFVNQDYLGFLSLDMDLMLDLVLHWRVFGKVAIDLAIHQERPVGHEDLFVQTMDLVLLWCRGGYRDLVLVCSILFFMYLVCTKI